MKQAIAFLVFLLIGTLAHGQEGYAKGNITLGFQVGASVATQSGTYPAATEPVVGVVSHVTGQYYITPHFSLIAGLGIEQKGSYSSQKFTTSTNVNPQTGFIGTPGTITTNTIMNYIILNMMAKYAFGNRNFNFFVEGGPYLGGLVQATQDLNAQSDSSFSIHSIDASAENGFQRIDFGAVLGVGIEKSITENLSINLETRLNVGLSNIALSFPGFPSSNTHNLSANLLVGITWKLGE